MGKFDFFKESSYEQMARMVDFDNKDELSNAICDFIDYAPFMAKIVSELIHECILRNKEYEDAFKRRITTVNDDPNIQLSRHVYGTYLGAQSNIDGLEKVSEVFNDLNCESDYLKTYDNDIHTFFAEMALKRLQFDQRICIGMLSKVKGDSIVKAVMKNQTIFNLSVLVQMCRYVDVLEEFEKKADELEHKNEIIGCVLINHFDTKMLSNTTYENQANSKLHERIAIIKRLLVDDTLEYCKKVANLEVLNKILGTTFTQPVLPKMSLNTFKNMSFNTKEEFLKAFLQLTSPSVSHFLTYLEMFRNEFKLDEKEKALFLQLLSTFHSENTGYLEIVNEKLQCFGILNNIK